MTSNVIIMGYSGHAYVVAEILLINGHIIKGYCDLKESITNPYGLLYLGLEHEQNAVALPDSFFFPSVGDNSIRKRIYQSLKERHLNSFAAIHPKSIVSSTAKVGEGSVVMAGAVINSLAEIGDAVIINTGAIIEHECKIHNFSHVAPGAVLAGKVQIGENAFIGANAVIKQCINIGKGAVIGAGAVVVRDVPDGVIIKGNPGK